MTAVAAADSPADFAPVLMLPGILAPAMCARVLEYYRGQCGGGEPSGVLHYRGGQPHFQIDPEVKMRREAIVSDGELQRDVHQCI